MCHHQSFLMDDCTTKQLEIDKKWVFSIFFAILTLKWPWCDFDVTLVLSTSKAQLLLMLLFVHKLRSCWCLHTNLTLQNILLFSPPPPPPHTHTHPPQEFSGGDASVPRSSALKGLRAAAGQTTKHPAEWVGPVWFIDNNNHIWLRRLSLALGYGVPTCLEAQLPSLSPVHVYAY